MKSRNCILPGILKVLANGTSGIHVLKPYYLAQRRVRYGGRVPTLTFFNVRLFQIEIDFFSLPQCPHFDNDAKPTLSAEMLSWCRVSHYGSVYHSQIFMS